MSVTDSTYRRLTELLRRLLIIILRGPAWRAHPELLTLEEIVRKDFFSNGVSSEPSPGQAALVCWSVLDTLENEGEEEWQRICQELEEFLERAHPRAQVS